MSSRGRVSFVGAGPGDPRLLTLRGAELLARADVVVIDADVHPAVLDHAPAGVECVQVARNAPPESNVAPMIARAREGKRVVRVFHGDPFAFRGGATELAGVRQADLDVEVAAGVVAPTAAAAYTGLALIRDADASPSVAIALVRDAGELHDWKKLSLATDTLALITDVSQVEAITQHLTYYGRSIETPAALARDVSLPSQKVATGTLVSLRASLAGFGEGPVLLVVGESIAARDALRWFDTRPLFGKRVLLTRAREQGARTAAMIRERGAEPVLAPTIALGPPADPGPLQAAVRDLGTYGWVAFTSENGVRFFWEELGRQGRDARALGGARLAAIGPGTAAALEAHGVRADVVAREFRGEGLAEAMLSAMDGTRPRVLIARAKEAREALPEALRAAGCAVDVVAAYETHAAPAAELERIAGLLERREVDVCTFTSASTVTHLCDALGPRAATLLAGVRVASIGPITTEAALARGVRVDVTAERYTLEGLLDALESSVPVA